MCAANAITHYCPDEAEAGYSGECTASISIEMTREFCFGNLEEEAGGGGFGEAP